MGLPKRDAHLALDQLAEYRNHLDRRYDGSLISALSRLMNVFQSRLFLALLDIQDFYDATLLDPGKSNEEKTAAALDVAMRWENISSPSLVASTINLRRSDSANELSSLERARSLYQLNLLSADDSPEDKLHREPPMRHKTTNLGTGNGRYRYDSIQPLHQSTSTLSFSMPNCTPSDQSPSQWINPGPNRLPDSAVFSEEPLSHGPPLHRSSCLDPIRPIAKPRQRRLKRPNSSAQRTTITTQADWTDSPGSADFDAQYADRLANESPAAMMYDATGWSGSLGQSVPITTEVIIDKSPQGFGFSIAGGRDDSALSEQTEADIVVTRISPGGAAEKDGGLLVGDRILSVNGISLIGVSHEEAVRALQLAGSRLKLVVERTHLMDVADMVEQPSPLRPNPEFSNPPSSSSTHRRSNHIGVSHPPAPVPPQTQRSTAPSGTSTGSSSNVALTNTSLASGSLYSVPGTASPHDSARVSKHNSSSIDRVVKVTDVSRRSGEKAVAECGRHDKELTATSSKTNRGTETRVRQMSAELGSTQKDQCSPPQPPPDSPTATSTPGSRKPRRNIMPSGLSTLSLCAGLHRSAGCSTILNESDHRATSAVSSARGRGSNRSIPSGELREDGRKSESNSTRRRRRTSSGSRPVPAPQPGPVLVEVALTRAIRSGLGFSIAGGVGNETLDGDSGIFVTKLTCGGVAETDGRIGIGDRIVQVNETSLVGVTHERAVNAMKQAGEQVELLIVKLTNSTSQPTVASIDDASIRRTKQSSLQSDKRSSTLLTTESPGTSSKSGDLGDRVSRRHSAHVLSSTTSAEQHLDNSDEDHQEKVMERQEGLEPSEITQRHEEDSTAPCFASTGQGLLEAQMVGLIDYAAAASVSDLITQWPNARLVTLHRQRRANKSNTSNPTHRSSGGSLGLNIVGGDGSEATFVSQLQVDKPAGQSRRVFVGDRLLSVNGLDVSRHGHEQAAAALRNAPDRVDLVLVYCPKDYGKFERCYSRQLKAVGHHVSSKSVDKAGPERTPSSRSKERHRKRSTGSHPLSQRDLGSSASDRPSDLSLPTNKRLVKRSPLFLRCQVDFDSTKAGNPKKTFQLQSGDVICVLNSTDTEWWQAQRVDPNANEPSGPIGLIPSRERLERCELSRTRQVMFLALQDSHSSESLPPSSQLGSRAALRDDRMGDVRITDPDTGSSAYPWRNKTPGVGLGGVTSFTSLGSGRTGGSDGKDMNNPDVFVLSYIAVTPVQLSFARPVVVLGHMKDRIADELLLEFPDRFGTAVPYTTRACRPNEVDGRDYHFVVSREIMVSDIASQRYLEAGEYNGNLYGTHLESVFEVAELGLHCLLDVGGPALRRLEAAGLPPVSLLILPESAFPVNNSTTNSSKSSVEAIPSDTPKRSSTDRGITMLRTQTKLARLVLHFSNQLTAIITTDDFEFAYHRVKELIFGNAGPLVWLNAPLHIP